MAKSFTVTPATLKAKSNELKQTNAKFKSQIQQLRTQESSLNQMWDGEANDKFHAAFHKDTVQMDNFYNAIEKYCKSLTDIARKYEQIERKNMATASERKY